ncbi:tetratricopeptide repeat protein [Arcticibacterium luteifluviistationis]|uniref:Uncharacterized protein n=1 Tax=Arcticibacterium luteifluviistationis TaxID=1784714 RepID=A0A2Z4G708_9BACT|nr:tetratricopeptide repeat protein [Arcticibacterium luteifluviistationis]AWV96863.1 hypothetical protein DJ013_01160 [Arcticibacterium luteifluviistationis]
MKKIVFALSFLVTAQLSQAQSVLDMANDAQCQTQENLLKPMIKSSEHAKRSLKPTTWIRLSEGYANYTTACGKDSTSAKQAWSAIHKAQELDTDGEYTDDIKAVMNGDLMYSAVMNQGVAHYNVGSLEKAVELFLIGMEVQPTDTLSSFYAGIVSNQLGNFDDASKAFQQYIEVANGRDAVSYYTLSTIAKEKGNLEESIKWLKKGVEDTGDKDIQGELINTYISNEMLDEAVGDMESLVASDPTNSNNLLNLGILYDNQGKKQKALDIYSKVLEMDPDNYDCNFNLAVFYFNDAVEIKKEVDAMDMKTYQKEGAAIEAKACAAFIKSKPYFEACDRIRPGTPDIVEPLNNLKNVLVQCK